MTMKIIEIKMGKIIFFCYNLEKCGTGNNIILSSKIFIEFLKFSQKYSLQKISKNFEHFYGKILDS